MQEKLKSVVGEERFFSGLLVLAVGVTSFLLGQASVVVGTPVETSGDERVVITSQKTPLEQEDVVQNSPADLSQIVVASKSGSRYHRIDCPGASQIKESNRIEFATIAEARAAGYTPASNCPGLQ